MARLKDTGLRIAKRGDLVWWKSWLIRIGFTAAGLALCLLLIYVMTGASPAKVLSATAHGAFGNSVFSRSTWTFVRDTCTLFMVALGLTLAFRMRFWNIGGEGQIMVGGLMTAICMKFLAGSMPNGVLLLMMAALAMLAGALWAFIPAVFKARWNTNETLFTLMMNYIAIQIVSFCEIRWEKKVGAGTIGVINAVGTEHAGAGWLPTSWFSEVLGKNNHVIILAVAVLLALAVTFYVRRTKHGYEIQVVGESENTARYAGISVKKVILRTMLMSGLLCGLVGFMIVSGSSHTISANTAGGRGFTAIVVAWLGQFNAAFMALISALLVLLGIGAREIATNFALNESMSDVMVGIILFFILASSFTTRYRVIRTHAHREGDTK